MLESFNFDDTFETRLLALLLRNNKFFLKNSNFVLEKYFKTTFNKDIYKRAKPILEKFGKPMTKDILRNEITKMYTERQKSDITIDEYFSVIDEIFAMDISFGEEYAEEAILQFARRKEMENVLTDGMKKIIAGQDLSPILPNVTRALSVGNKMRMGYDYFGEVAIRTSLGYEDMRQNKVSTGLKRLNGFLDGGLAGGELGVITSPTNRGKTALLCNFAFGGVKDKKDVIYIVLEGKIDDVAFRLDKLICEADKNVLRSGMLEYGTSPKEHISLVSRLFKSKIIIQMFPAESVTVSDIDAYISHEQAISGFEADLIIIDYLALCKRSNPRDETWMGTTYREGKAISVRRNIPLWTAVQAKADEALRAKRIRPGHIAEATNRIQSDADVIIGLCQTDEEAESKVEPSSIRLWLGKNRNEVSRREIEAQFHREKMWIREVSLSGTTTA